MSAWSSFHTLTAIRGNSDHLFCGKCRLEFNLQEAIRHAVMTQPDLTRMKP